MDRSTARATREDYDRLPEEVKAELIDGEIVVTPGPSDWHEHLVTNLIFSLHDHLGIHGVNRIHGSRTEVATWEGSEEQILQPDAVVFPEGTKPTGKSWKAPTPVWVAEVLSPSTAKRDRGVKLRIYAAAKVREAWLVDPDAETIEVVDLVTKQRHVHGKGERAASTAIPGFALDVTAFFAV
jgi:Uma2 family endonuclease